MVLDRARRCTWSAPRRACRRSIRRVRPSFSLWRVGNSSPLGAARLTMSSACSASSSVGAGSCTCASRSRSSTSRWALSRDGSASAISSDGRLRRAIALLPARLVVHQQAKAAHEGVLRREPGDQPREQHRRAVQDLLGGVGAGEQLEAALEQARRHDRLARIGTAAEGGVDLRQQRLAEAARQPGARQAEQVADLAQAHALQRLPVLAARAEQPDRRRRERLARRLEVGAARRRLDAGEDRRALQPSRRRRCAARGRAAATACRSRSQQAIEAAEIAQARLDLEQHRVRRGAGRSAGCSDTLGVKASAAWRPAAGPRRRAPASAWPRTMRGASASAVARFSPGLTPSACAAALAADDPVLVDQRDRPTRPAPRHRPRPASPRTIRARDDGRCSAIQSTMRRAGKGNVDRSRHAADRRHDGAQAKLTKVAAAQLEARSPGDRCRERRRAALDSTAGNASCRGCFERRPAPLQHAARAADRRRRPAAPAAAATPSAAPRATPRAARTPRRRGCGRRAAGGAAARRAGAAAARRARRRHGRSSTPARAPRDCRCRERRGRGC